MEIIEASESDIPRIISIAKNTWPSSYAKILTQAQIDYMLNAIYNVSDLSYVIRNNTQKFLLLKDNQEYPGFAAFGPRQEDANVFKLFKLYVLPSYHGKGYGKLLLDEIKGRLRAQNITTLDLNVNRYNPAIDFYKKAGFTIIKEEDVPIGPYWMNDYVMRMKI
jgi:ribosomal protein S18 acetylase RimI-like enzyme